jgi:hypothetical protein
MASTFRDLELVSLTTVCDNDRHYKEIRSTLRFLQRSVHRRKQHGLWFGPCAKAYLTFIELGKRPLISAGTVPANGTDEARSL